MAIFPSHFKPLFLGQKSAKQNQPTNSISLRESSLPQPKLNKKASNSNHSQTPDQFHHQSFNQPPNQLASIAKLWVAGLLIGLITASGVGALLFHLSYQDKIIQGVSIDQTAVGGLTKQQALTKLEQRPLIISESQPVLIKVDNVAQQSALNSVIAGKKYQRAVEQAFNLGRQGGPLARLTTIIRGLQQDHQITANYDYRLSQLKTQIQQLAQQIDYAAVEPQAELTTSGQTDSLKINPGKMGREVEVEATLTTALAELDKNLLKIDRRTNTGNAQTDTNKPPNTNRPPNIDKEPSADKQPNTNKQTLVSSTAPIVVQAKVASTGAELNLEELDQTHQRLENFVGRSIVFYTQKRPDSPLPDYPIQEKNLNDQKLVELAALPSGYNHQKITETVADWASQLDRPAVNAEFDYDPETLQVTKFQPPQQGWQLNQSNTVDQIIKLLKEIEKSDKTQNTTANRAGQKSKTSDSDPSLSTDENPTADQDQITDQEIQPELSAILNIETALPKKSLADTNELGINQLIGFGDSHYDHSIPSRIHNVKITAEKLSLTIVRPGEEFSFNQAVGEVSRATGYKPAYIIKDGRTMLGDGGGVCQVSTTTFRAVMNAGLDITLRLPHSYRVSYYELDKQPGFDATVYSGNVDFRFVNDTGQHLLIYSTADSDNLYMKVEIYGTDDGRQVEIKNYQKWGYQPPPPPQYIPDASLPPGQLRQIDWAASGIKTSFDWIVKDKNGEVLHQETFYSHYRPWAAKYLQGV